MTSGGFLVNFSVCVCIYIYVLHAAVACVLVVDYVLVFFLLNLHGSCMGGWASTMMGLISIVLFCSVVGLLCIYMYMGSEGGTLLASKFFDFHCRSNCCSSSGDTCVALYLLRFFLGHHMREFSYVEYTYVLLLLL